MDLINLPVLPDDTSRRAALAVLPGVSLSGLVTVRDDDVLLVRASDLYKWRSRKPGHKRSERARTAPA